MGGYLVCVLVLSALLAGVGWMLGSDLCAFNRGALTTATIEVTADDTVATVADKLQDAGLIKYKWFFKLFAGLAHADKKIGIGTYELNTEMDYRALILGMHNASGNMTAETVTVTIPEGYTVRQTEKAIQKMLNPPEPAPVKKPSSPQYKKISSILAKQFGTPVNISGQGSRGSIEITFSSKAEFIRILELLGQDEWPDSK